jgi:hypothetical protein
MKAITKTITLPMSEKASNTHAPFNHDEARRRAGHPPRPAPRPVVRPLHGEPLQDVFADIAALPDGIRSQVLHALFNGTAPEEQQ